MISRVWHRNHYCNGEARQCNASCFTSAAESSPNGKFVPKLGFIMKFVFFSTTWDNEVRSLSLGTNISVADQYREPSPCGFSMCRVLYSACSANHRTSSSSFPWAPSSFIIENRFTALSAIGSSTSC